MAAVAVVFDGVRFSTADLSTSGGTWDKYGSTQAPALEEDIILQGPTEQSNKVSNATGGVQFTATTPVDFATVPKTIIAKIQVTTIKAIDVSVARGMSYEIGSGSGDNYQYYLVGSGAGDEYPVNAGWWTIIIDPNVAAHRDNTVGTPVLGSLDWIGVYLDIAAQVKAENIIHSSLDYVDNGEGLTLIGGDGGDTDGTLLDFVIEDEDVNTTPGEFDNRWRLAKRIDGSDKVLGAVGWWTMGGAASPAVVTDSNRTITWDAGRVDTGFHGLRANIENASSVLTLSGFTFVSNGIKATNDSRADFEMVGTSGSAPLNDLKFDNFRSFLFTSAGNVSGWTLINPEILTQNGATLSGFTIDQPTTAANEAFLIADDIELVTLSSFASSGTGHAVDLGTIAATATIIWNNTESGYVAGVTGSPITPGTSGNETILVSVDSGQTLTISVASGASTPSVKNDGLGDVNVIAGAVTVAVTVLNDDTGLPIGTTARVQIMLDSDKSILLSTACNASGVASTSYSGPTPVDILGWAREFNISAPDFVSQDFSGEITSSGFNLTIRLKPI